MAWYFSAVASQQGPSNRTKTNLGSNLQHAHVVIRSGNSSRTILAACKQSQHIQNVRWQSLEVAVESQSQEHAKGMGGMAWSSASSTDTSTYSGAQQLVVLSNCYIRTGAIILNTLGLYYYGIAYGILVLLSGVLLPLPLLELLLLSTVASIQKQSAFTTIRLGLHVMLVHACRCIETNGIAGRFEGCWLETRTTDDMTWPVQFADSQNSTQARHSITPMSCSGIGHVHCVEHQFILCCTFDSTCTPLRQVNT
jgi:hypothetical protein